MNYSVLRGLCQKCEDIIEWQIWKADDGKEQHGHFHKDANSDLNCDGKPVWFLSPNQIRIIYASDKFWKWRMNKKVNIERESEGIAAALEEIPFLVAKILSKTGSSEDSLDNYKVTVERAVNISENPDALFDVCFSDEEWDKKYRKNGEKK